MTRILVVDDDPDLLALVDVQLRKNGHRVATARNGREALDVVAAKGRPDVAILDVAMPQMDGFELLRALRAMPGQADLPAIFLTAKVEPKDIEVGRSLGATYLTKPYVMNALLKAIESAVTDEDIASSW